MKPPPSIELIEPDIDPTKYILNFKKGIYGLKQAGFLWNQEIKKTLLSLGLKQSDIDPGLFWFMKDGKLTLITIYVDDILTATNYDPTREWIKNELSKGYKTICLGRVNSILGAIIEQHDEGIITMNQTNNLKEIGELYDVENMRIRNTPVNAGLKLSKGTADESVKTYRQIIGKLSYTALLSRPDIAYATNYLGRFSSCNDSEHMKPLMELVNFVYKVIFRRLPGKHH